MAPVTGFLLGLLAAQAAAKPDELAGWYALADGGHVLVTHGASGGMRLFDFERPAFDVLFETDDGLRWRR
jgi:hypothetical protein